MRRIRQRLRAIKPRRAALFLAVFALAAAAMYFGGREAGVGRPTEAGTAVLEERTSEPAPQNDGEEAGDEASVEPLTLTLSAPATCEGTHPRGGWAHGLEWDEEKGEWEDVQADAWWYWDSVGTIEVAWAAGGGGGDYTVTIAGETHIGASGTAEVSCAQRHGPIIDDPWYGRIHPDEHKPVVDSGLKTITATVADGSGAAAEATAEVYVILAVEGDHVMKSGETYRVHDWLVTVPDGINIDKRGVEKVACENQREDGTVNESINCQNYFHLAWESPGYYAVLTLGMKDGAEGSRAIWLDEFDQSDKAAAAAAADLYWDVDAKLSALAASVGVPPQLDDG